MTPYLDPAPPRDDVLAVEEYLARDVVTVEEAELAPPVHHLAGVLPPLRLGVQLVHFPAPGRAGREDGRLGGELALLLDRGGGGQLGGRGQRPLVPRLLLAGHGPRAAAPGPGPVQEVVHLTPPAGAGARCRSCVVRRAVPRRGNVRHQQLGVDVLVPRLLRRRSLRGQHRGQLHVHEASVRTSQIGFNGIVAMQ